MRVPERNHLLRKRRLGSEDEARDNEYKHQSHTNALSHNSPYFFDLGDRIRTVSPSTDEPGTCVALSSTLRIVSASSFFTMGFMTNSRMPTSFAFSADTISLYPVQRMIGISLRTRSIF